MSLPWLLAHRSVTFPNEGFFTKISFEQANMPCPWQNAYKGYLGYCFLPFEAAMDMAACLSHDSLAHGCYLDLV